MMSQSSKFSCKKYRRHVFLRGFKSLVVYGHLHKQKMSKEKDDALRFSEYANTLDPLVKKRYIQKIACIGVDPFLISCQKYDEECLPPTESIDLVSYLVLETSHYTKEQFKAFQSLQAYNQLVSGFVQSVHGLITAGKHVVLGKVRHSQKMNNPTAVITPKQFNLDLSKL